MDVGDGQVGALSPVARDREKVRGEVDADSLLGAPDTRERLLCRDANRAAHVEQVHEWARLMLCREALDVGRERLTHARSTLGRSDTREVARRHALSRSLE